MTPRWRKIECFKQGVPTWISGRRGLCMSRAPSKVAGFNGVDTAVRDAESPYHYCAAIVSRKGAALGAVAPQPMNVGCDYPETGISKALVNGLKNAGVSIQIASLEHRIAPNQSVIGVLHSESHFFENITADRLDAFQQLLKISVNNSLNFWLVRLTQVNCQDPRSGHAIGVARSTHAESSIPIYPLETSQEDPNFLQLVLDV